MPSMTDSCSRRFGLAAKQTSFHGTIQEPLRTVLKLLQGDGHPCELGERGRLSGGTELALAGGKCGKVKGVQAC